MGKKLTTEEFIEKANVKHNNEYDYSQVEYINNIVKIKIICKKHGIFEQIPNSHLNSRGCPKCGNIKKNSLRTLNNETFKLKSILLHGNKYDYSLASYINNYTSVIISCKKHGNFNQKPYAHLNGQGCPKCAGKYLDNEYFIEKAKSIHGEKYDYSLINYSSSKSKIEIICDKHGVFLQTPTDHLSGCGCPKCTESQGERKIRIFLEENNINYIHEKTFDDCKNKYKLPFDFYLPNQNILIEYDGIQHFKSFKYFGGVERFISLRNNDNIKTNYAQANNINLIRIAYNENVEEKLLEIL